MPAKPRDAASVEWGSGVVFSCQKTGEAAVQLAAECPSRGLQWQQAAWACLVLAGVLGLLWYRSGLAWGALAGSVGTSAFLGLVFGRLASAAVVKESVIVLGEVGIQVSAETRGGRRTKRLVDAGKVRAAIINEHVSLFGVHDYVGLIVDGLDHMEVLFPSFHLPIPLVEHTCWSVSHVLLGEPEPPALSQARFDQRRAQTTWGGLRRAEQRPG